MWASTLPDPHVERGGGQEGRRHVSGSYLGRQNRAAQGKLVIANLVPEIRKIAITSAFWPKL